ncbi:hypothetical protein RRG08_004468, partial [Elysia crispata]
MLKRKFKRTRVDSLGDMEDVVKDSTRGNIAQLCRNERDFSHKTLLILNEAHRKIGLQPNEDDCLQIATAAKGAQLIHVGNWSHDTAAEMKKAILASLHRCHSTDEHPQHTYCPPGPDSWCFP